MTEIQEIHFFTQQGEKIVTRIEKDSSGSFIGYISPTSNKTIIAPILTHYGPSVGSFPTAIEAFQEIVRLIGQFAQNTSDHITIIKNPSHTPFLSLADQKISVNANIAVK